MSRELLKRIYKEQRFNFSEPLCKEIEAALAEPEPEPVAWLCPWGDNPFFTRSRAAAEKWDKDGNGYPVALYTHPPRQHEPVLLKESKVRKIWEDCSGDFFEFIKLHEQAILKANGIIK